MLKDNYYFLRQRQNPIQIRHITQGNVKTFSPYLLHPDRYTDGIGTAFGAYRYNTPCGTLELLIEGGYVRLCSVHVDEEHRNAGVGSALLERAKNLTIELEFQEIYTEFMLSDKEQAHIQSFLTSNGFLPAESGMSLLIVRPAGLNETELFRKTAALGPLKNIVPMNTLPDLPRNVKGRIIENLSLGYLNAERVLGAFVIVTEQDRQLHISAAFTDKNSHSQFVRLIVLVLQKIAKDFPNHPEIYVTADNPGLQSVLDKLADGNEETIQKQTLYRMIWSLDNELAGIETWNAERTREAAINTPDGMEILVPKIMQLLDILVDRNMRCELMMGKLPYLMLENLMTVRYVPLADDFSRFALCFHVVLHSDKSMEELAKDCIRINGESFYFTAIPQDGYLLLRYILPEYQIPVTEEQFLACVEELLRDLSLIALS